MYDRGMPAKFDISIYRGDTFEMDVFLTGDGATPLELNEFYQIDGEIRRAGPSPLSPTRELLATFDTSIVDGENGQVRAALTAAVADSLPSGIHSYDLQWTRTPTEPLAGTFEAVQNSTGEQPIEGGEVNEDFWVFVPPDPPPLEWDALVAYEIGDTVTFEGVVYESLTDPNTGNPPVVNNVVDATNWDEVIEVPPAAWDAAAGYTTADTVFFSGQIKLNQPDEVFTFVGGRARVEPDTTFTGAVNG